MKICHTSFWPVIYRYYKNIINQSFLHTFLIRILHVFDTSCVFVFNTDKTHEIEHKLNWLFSFHDKSLINICLRIKKERITNYIIFYEAEFIQGLPNKQAPSRNFHIDDLHVLMTIERIYFCQLEIKKTTDSSNAASYINFNLEIDNKGRLTKECSYLTHYNIRNDLRTVMVFMIITNYIWRLVQKRLTLKKQLVSLCVFDWKFVLTYSLYFIFTYITVVLFLSIRIVILSAI